MAIRTGQHSDNIVPVQLAQRVMMPMEIMEAMLHGCG